MFAISHPERWTKRLITRYNGGKIRERIELLWSFAWQPMKPQCCWCCGKALSDTTPGFVIRVITKHADDPDSLPVLLSIFSCPNHALELRLTVTRTISSFPEKVEHTEEDVYAPLLKALADAGLPVLINQST